LRTGEKQYHDRVFEEEIKELIDITQNRYEQSELTAFAFHFYVDRFF